MKGSMRLVWCIFLLFAATAQAGIITFGEIGPPDPSTWTSGGTFPSVGVTFDGTVIVYDGSDIESYGCNLGSVLGVEGQITIDGIGSTWTNGNYLYIGRYGDGTLNVTNGGAVSNGIYCYVGNEADTTGKLFMYNGSTLSTHYAYVGRNAGSSGEVVVYGANTTFTNSSTLYVGYGGSSSMLVKNGGTVSSTGGYVAYQSGSVGEVDVVGDDATWTTSSTLYIGNYGDAALNIASGGEVMANSSVSVGRYAGSTGEVKVSGSDSKLTSSAGLLLGDYGSAKLNILNGGEVTCSYSSLGGFTGTGTAMLFGSDATWTLSNSLFVGAGAGASGELTVMYGGKVNSATSYIAYQAGSDGTVTVDVTGSVLANSDDLYVGYNGLGMLDITNGGLVSVGGTLTIDYNDDGDSFIRMSDGGMLAVAGDADDSLNDFLTNLVFGTDAIMWWDDVIEDWTSLLTASSGTDYTLAYQTGGDLAGYTLLTVTASGPGDGDSAAVPEPGTIALMLSAVVGLGFVALRKRRSAK